MKFRTARMFGAITALLGALFWFERVWEVWDAKAAPLARFGELFSPYGALVLAEIALRVMLGFGLLWVFVRIGSSKPLPRLGRPAA